MIAHCVYVILLHCQSARERGAGRGWSAGGHPAAQLLEPPEVDAALAGSGRSRPDPPLPTAGKAASLRGRGAAAEPAASPRRAGRAQADLADRRRRAVARAPPAAGGLCGRAPGCRPAGEACRGRRSRPLSRSSTSSGRRTLRRSHPAIRRFAEPAVAQPRDPRLSANLMAPDRRRTRVACSRDDYSCFSAADWISCPQR